MGNVELNFSGSGTNGRRRALCALVAGMIVLALAGSASGSTNVPPNTLAFTEAFSEKASCTPGTTNCVVTPTDRLSVSARVSLTGVDIGLFGPGTAFTLDLGGLSISNALSDDPKYSLGKPSATFTRTGLNGSGKPVVLLTVHLSWSLKWVNVSVSGNSSNFTILAGLVDGLPPGTIATNIAGSVVLGDANGVFDPVLATGTLVTRNAGSPAQTSAINLKARASAAPVPPGDPLIAARMGSGYFHTLAEATNGVVYAWGFNGSGQLGSGTNFNSPLAQPVAGLTNVLALAGGYSHSLAVATDNTVLAWGQNDLGQLGNGTTNTSFLPAPVPGLSNIVSVASWLYHNLAADNQGNLWAWGNNFSGQLGIGSTNNSGVPAEVTGLSHVVAAAAGAYHSLAADDTGAAWAWGYNGYGQLGDGTTNGTFVPAQVPGLSNVIGVAGGLFHSLAVDSNGTVWAWGYNAYGQLGIGGTNLSYIPVAVPGISNAVAVACGQYHSLALGADGAVWAWGYNGYGQLGNGTTNQASAPTLVPGLTNIVAVGAGVFQSTALDSAGAVWSWGADAYGQLGNGLTNQSLVPVQVRIHRP